MRSPFSRASRYLRKPIPIWVSRILLGAALGFLAAGTSHGASVAGQVFEVVNPEAPMSQWTRLPSTDAYVIVSWFDSVPRPGHASSVCLHTAICKTDEHGRFNVSGSWAAPKVFPVIRKDSAVYVYKPGFDQQSDGRGNGAPVVRTLVRSKLAAEHRVALLSMAAESGCRDHDTYKIIPLGDPQGIAVSFYRALYEEALTLDPPPHKFNHYLMPLREMAGVPEPPPPKWEIRAIRPRAPRPAAPADRP